MASSPITSWEIDGETVETVSDFIFWAPKSLQMVTAAMKLGMNPAAQLAIIKQLRRHVSCGPGGDYQADEQALIT